jgi:hypothetical protein
MADAKGKIESTVPVRAAGLALKGQQLGGKVADTIVFSGKAPQLQEGLANTGGGLAGPQSVRGGTETEVPRPMAGDEAPQPSNSLLDHGVPVPVNRPSAPRLPTIEGNQDPFGKAEDNVSDVKKDTSIDTAAKPLTSRTYVSKSADVEKAGDPLARKTWSAGNYGQPTQDNSGDSSEPAASTSAPHSPAKAESPATGPAFGKPVYDSLRSPGTDPDTKSDTGEGKEVPAESMAVDGGEPGKLPLDKPVVGKKVVFASGSASDQTKLALRGGGLAGRQSTSGGSMTVVAKPTPTEMNSTAPADGGRFPKQGSIK